VLDKRRNDRPECPRSINNRIGTFNVRYVRWKYKKNKNRSVYSPQLFRKYRYRIHVIRLQHFRNFNFETVATHRHRTFITVHYGVRSADRGNLNGCRYEIISWTTRAHVFMERGYTFYLSARPRCSRGHRRPTRKPKTNARGGRECSNWQNARETSRILRIESRDTHTYTDGRLPGLLFRLAYRYGIRDRGRTIGQFKDDGRNSRSKTATGRVSFGGTFEYCSLSIKNVEGA